MKLYTEEQVRQFLDMYSKEDVDDIISSLTPIELPSDEEIDNVASDRFMFGADQGKFINGARWMKEQIVK